MGLPKRVGPELCVHYFYTTSRSLNLNELDAPASVVNGVWETSEHIWEVPWKKNSYWRVGLRRDITSGTPPQSMLLPLMAFVFLLVPYFSVSHC